MKFVTFGLILCLIGLVGGLIAYISAGVYHDLVYFKMGLLANCIQGVGLVFIFKGRN